MKKTLLFLLILCLIFIYLIQKPDQNYHLIACDVGQGDATLLIKGSTQVLIDGGPSEKVLACLEEFLPFWDRKIELVVLSHPQKDHFGGLKSVTERYQIGTFVLPKESGEDRDFWEFRKAVLAEKAPIFSPKNQDQIKISQISLTFFRPGISKASSVWAQEGENLARQVLGLEENKFKDLARDYNGTEDLNQISQVVSATFGSLKILVTGDIGFPEELSLVHQGLIGDIDILKVAHHGSKFSSSADFLAVAKPEIALISSGKNNRYGHPAAETLERLDHSRTHIFRTDQSGSIHLVSDGVKIWQKQ